MKGLLFFLLLFSSSLRAQEPIVTKDYVEFSYKFDTFNRKLLGCPLKPENITKEDCHPKEGIVDMKLWRELNEKAQKIFTYGRKANGKSPSHQSQ